MVAFGAFGLGVAVLFDRRWVSALICVVVAPLTVIVALFAQACLN